MASVGDAAGAGVLLEPMLDVPSVRLEVEYLGVSLPDLCRRDMQHRKQRQSISYVLELLQPANSCLISIAEVAVWSQSSERVVLVDVEYAAGREREEKIRKPIKIMRREVGPVGQQLGLFVLLDRAVFFVSSACCEYVESVSGLCGTRTSELVATGVSVANRVRVGDLDLDGFRGRLDLHERCSLRRCRDVAVV